VLRGLISFPDQSLGGGGRLPTIPREGVAPVKGRNPQGPWEPSPSKAGRRSEGSDRSRKTCYL